MLSGAQVPTPRMTVDPPHRAYYRSVAGQWRGSVDLAITDWAAFRRSGISIVDRLRLVSMLATARLLGPCRLDTSVDASRADRDHIVHTTRVSKWGMTLLQSVEHIALAPGGRDATMRVEMRLAPTLWRTRVETDTPVTVDAAGSGASYRFTWFGTEMRQEALRSDDGQQVVLIQTTRFSRGEQRLRRRTST